MTKIIGLTGGIGSGKSTVAAMMRDLGIPVYMADDEARKITETEAVSSQIGEHFGNDVFTNDKIDRSKLASLVFADPQKLQILNAIIHPAVRAHFKKWASEHSDVPMIVKEAAILFESGSNSDCDFVITVAAPEEDRISRVIKRDSTTREAVISRIKSQLSDEERIAKSDFVIYNDSISTLGPQLTKILKKISKS